MPVKTAGCTPQQQADARNRAFMDAIYSSRYHRKNRDERNRKTRERMAALRLREVTLPPQIAAGRLEAKREAARKYRERPKWGRHKFAIARRARERREVAAQKRGERQELLAKLEACVFSNQEWKALQRGPAALSCASSGGSGSVSPAIRSSHLFIKCVVSFQHWIQMGNTFDTRRLREMGPGQRHDSLEAGRIFEFDTVNAARTARANDDAALVLRRVLEGTGDSSLERGELWINLDFLVLDALSPDQPDSSLYRPESESVSDGDELPALESPQAGDVSFQGLSMGGGRCASEELPRQEASMLHNVGYVTAAEFEELVTLYLEEDLELYVEYKWLHEKWVRTLAHMVYLGCFLENMSLRARASDLQKGVEDVQAPPSTLLGLQTPSSQTEIGGIFAFERICASLLTGSPARLSTLLGLHTPSSQADLRAQCLDLQREQLLQKLRRTDGVKARQRARARLWAHCEKEAREGHRRGPGRGRRDCGGGAPRTVSLAPSCAVGGGGRRGARRLQYLVVLYVYVQQVPSHKTRPSSASAVVTGSSGATAPIYHEWEKAVAAWQVGCALGWHAHLHGVDPAPPATPMTLRRARAINSPLSPAGGQFRRSETGARREKSPPPAPVASTPSGRSYAVRWLEEGMVCSTFEQAMTLYEELDVEGLCPRMLTSSYGRNALFGGFPVQPPRAPTEGFRLPGGRRSLKIRLSLAGP
ncbi:hypothetical protein B0H11DRAFT_1943991 [Mycena galericulata]|nr:hypothetical protein B0H11DRAFT_1943991 [Mycena galericulata]